MKNTGSDKQKTHESKEAAHTVVNQENNHLLRMARIATGTSVRWKRSLKAKFESEEETGTEEKRKEEEATYESRLLACTRCGAKQETTEKQLKINIGFRAIHCNKCGKQERVHSNRCSCNVVWHQCPSHRVDPPVHNPKGSCQKEKRWRR